MNRLEHAGLFLYFLMHADIDRILLTEQEIQRKVQELGQRISRDYASVHDILLVGVLKGCMMFMVDLARAITVPVSVDFIAISSYGASSKSSGVVRLLKDLDTSITGRHVLIVEDIIDSGLTLAYLCNLLEQRQPASLRVCALLDKQTHRTPNIIVDYPGFDIPDEFVVGYGLDFQEHYRNLPYIGVLNTEMCRNSS